MTLSIFRYALKLASHTKYLDAKSEHKTGKFFLYVEMYTRSLY